ncbi:MAG: energy transducer TonB [Archangium sp.]
MFDSVLSKGPAPRRRFGIGTFISVAAHAALIGLVAFLTSSKPEENVAPMPDLKFFASRPAPRGSAVKSPASPVKKQQSATRKQTKKFVQPTAITEPAPPAVDDQDDVPLDDGPSVGALLDGDDNDDDSLPPGDPNGTDDSDGPGGGGEEVVPFGEGMTRPECDRSVLSDLYSRSREAREARIEGSLILQCSIMATGEVRDCRAIKPLPHLTDAALEAMTQMKCKPATFQGRPISIKYVQNFQLVLPH